MSVLAHMDATNHPTPRSPGVSDRWARQSKEGDVIEVVYAKDDFPVGDPNGGQQRVWKGSHWPVDDPVVQEFPERFSADPRYGLRYSREPAGYDDPPVEQATAAPGERRNVRRPEHRG